MLIRWFLEKRESKEASRLEGRAVVGVVVAEGEFFGSRKSEYTYMCDDKDMSNGNGTLSGGYIAWLIDM